nr:MAG TPA: hypothetical protein [Bacteriophage sp.]
MEAAGLPLCSDSGRRHTSNARRGGSEQRSEGL